MGDAAVGEPIDGKIAVIDGEIADQGAGQDAHVAGGAQLSAMRQAGSVAERGPVHAELAGLGRHLQGEAAFRAAHIFGDHGGGVIGRLGDQGQDRVLDGDPLATAQPQPRCRLTGGAGGNPKLAGGGPQLRFQRLENQIDGHHLGQRSGIIAGVGVDLVDHAPGFGVHDQGRILGEGGLRAPYKKDGKEDRRQQAAGPKADGDCFPFPRLRTRQIIPLDRSPGGPPDMNP